MSLTPGQGAMRFEIEFQGGDAPYPPDALVAGPFEGHIQLWSDGFFCDPASAEDAGIPQHHGGLFLIAEYKQGLWRWDGDPNPERRYTDIIVRCVERLT